MWFRNRDAQILPKARPGDHAQSRYKQPKRRSKDRRRVRRQKKRMRALAGG